MDLYLAFAVLLVLFIPYFFQKPWSKPVSDKAFRQCFTVGVFGVGVLLIGMEIPVGRDLVLVSLAYWFGTRSMRPGRSRSLPPRAEED